MRDFRENHIYRESCRNGYPPKRLHRNSNHVFGRGSGVLFLCRKFFFIFLRRHSRVLFEELSKSGLIWKIHLQSNLIDGFSRLAQLKQNYEPYKAQYDVNLLLAILLKLSEYLQIVQLCKGIRLTIESYSTVKYYSLQANFTFPNTTGIPA